MFYFFIRERPQMSEVKDLLPQIAKTLEGINRKLGQLNTTLKRRDSSPTRKTEKKKATPKKKTAPRKKPAPKPVAEKPVEPPKATSSSSSSSEAKKSKSSSE